MSKYVELAKAPTQYAKRMNFLSKRIFGEVARQTDASSMKVVNILSERPLNKQNYFINWYPRHVQTHFLTMKLRQYGLFRDEHQDFKEEMYRLRKLRGKVPTKKGEGKRSTK